MDDCLDYARAAVRGITEADADAMPSLLMVSTHPDAKAFERQHGELSTSKILDLHDPEGKAASVFRTVQCVGLTRFAEEIPDSAVEYAADVRALTEDIFHNLADPFPFSESVWLRLLKTVAVQCSHQTVEPISMKRALRAACSDPVIVKCVTLFQVAGARQAQEEFVAELLSQAAQGNFQFNPDMIRAGAKKEAEGVSKAIVQELLWRMTEINYRAAARAALRILFLLSDAGHEATPAVEILVSSLDDVVLCPSACHTQFQGVGFESKSLEPDAVKASIKPIVAQCKLPVGHDGDHQYDVLAKLLPKKSRHNLWNFWTGSSSIATMTWKADVGDPFRPSAELLIPGSGDGAQPVWKHLAENWQPFDKEFAVGTKLNVVAEAILEEEFGSLEYRKSLGSQLVSGLGTWQDANAKAAFCSNSVKKAKDIRHKLKGVFDGAQCRRPIGQPEASVDEPPQHFVCPLTLDVFEDPVVAMDGITYERAAVERWLETHNTSPYHGAPLTSNHVVPNIAMRQLTREWRAKGS